MLIECIGLPGSGKTTITAQIARHLRPWQVRGGSVRKLQYRWARVLNGLHLTPWIDQPVVRNFVNRHVPDRRIRKAQDFNLSWRARMVRAYQRRSGPIVSDELLIQGIFMAIGPLEEPRASIRGDVEELILSVYRSPRVKFLHIDPPRDQWRSQVNARARGPSRFGRESSPSTIRSLERDRLFSGIILPILRAHHFAVVPVTRTNSADLRDLVAVLV
jgi:hypothetical protein